MSSKEVSHRVIEPEVVPRDAPDPWIEKLAWIMDRSIPIGRWRIGLDGIIGLVPGLGDLVGALISALIVAAGVQGIVIIEATIDPRGRVVNATVLRGVPVLDEAALDAVRKWVYTPTLLNGVPTPIIMTVTVRFRLTAAS